MGRDRLIGVVLQARMGSTRLPGKVLMGVRGKSMLDHILFRLTRLNRPAKIVVATSVEPEDNPIKELCYDKAIECFKGSEADVLERYYLCAKKYGFENIVRLTGDNPFVDIEELDRLIELHLASKADYSHSFGELPVGVGAEIFSFEALERSHREGTEENHREHVNEYIQEHPELFKTSVLTVPDEKKRPGLRLTVDTEEDLLKARRIVEESGGKYVTTEMAIELCSQSA